MVLGLDARRLAAGVSSYATEWGLPAFAAVVLAFMVLPRAQDLARVAVAAAVLGVVVHAAVSLAKSRRAAERERQANAAMGQAAEAIEAAGRMTLAVLQGLTGEVIPAIDKTRATAAAMSDDRRLSAPVRGRAKAIQASSEDALTVLQAFVRPSHQASEAAEMTDVAMTPVAPQKAFKPEQASANDLADANQAHEAEPIPEAEAVEAPRSLDGLRVLVGESNGVHQLMLRTLLAQLGAEAEIVGDGIELMETWRDGRWDLILLDVQMPRMDGLAAARMIRSVEGRFNWSPTPIVALAPESSARQTAACAEAGVYACVGKPIAGDALFAAIADAFAAPGQLLAESPAQTARVA